MVAGPEGPVESNVEVHATSARFKQTRREASEGNCDPKSFERLSRRRRSRAVGGETSVDFIDRVDLVVAFPASLRVFSGPDAKRRKEISTKSQPP